MTKNGLHHRNNDGGISQLEETTPLMMSSNSSDDSIANERKSAPLCSRRLMGGWISIVALLLLGFGIAFARIFPFMWRNDSPVQEPQRVVVVPDIVSVKDEEEMDSSSSSKSDDRSDSRPLNSIDQEPEILSDKVPYRALCEYYTPPSRRMVSLSPRILQTSLHEADKPWSTMQPCLVHAPNTPVEINTAAAPDAILNVSFSATRSKSPTILGFGGAFTEATSRNFYTLSEGAQQTVLELLFGSAIGLGYSMARIPIHSCDFSVASYTFDDEDNDFDLSHFDTTLQHDTKTIELVQRAVQTFTKGWGSTLSTSASSPFRLVASPWSPPAWMKRPTWEDSKHAVHAAKMTYSAEPNCLREGVGPNSKYAAVWARYLSQYISSYQALANVSFWALTVQNEPEFAAPWEACSYSAQNMTDFVQYHLGPTMRLDHPQLHILGFDHNKDHVNAWMMTMLNHTNDTSGGEAAQFIAGTAYHWYAGGMDRLLDGALGTANLHRYRESLTDIGLGGADQHILLGTEACHCPTTGYAGGDINIYWDRAERYAHTVLADLAAGSQGWIEWNLVLDSIGGPNHLGNICDAPVLAVPHRALDASGDLAPLPDFEGSSPMGGRIIGDERTREELNALGFQAKYLDLGIAVQPLFYYMGHISRYVRPGSKSVPALVLQGFGNGDTFRPVGSTVAGGGQNDLARDGIELLLWPCEGSTRQQFKWNYDESQHIVVFGHDWLGNQTKSCIGRAVDKDFMGMRLTTCTPSTAGKFEVMPIADDDRGRFMVRLLNHPTHKGTLCLTILELKNGGGSYGPLGGAQVALGDCSHPSAKWSLDLEAGEASSIYFADNENDNEVCITTGWPFLQMGAFLTPQGSSAKTVVILNEAKNSANYALKDDGIVLLTGSIPPRSIQTILLD